MACNYCYIPKIDELKEIDDKIVENMKDGSYLDWIEEYFGEDLKIISLWGTEPTINLEVFQEYMLDKLVDRFPKFNKIAFSSNMLSNADKIINLAKKLESIDKDFSLDLQFSDDGLEFTNENRHQGAGSKIRKNVKYTISEIDKLDLDGVSVSSHFKPTLTMENIKELLESNRVKGWFDYFEDEYFSYFDSEIKNKDKMRLSTKALPTLICPGEYTIEDGFLWNNFVSKLLELSKSDNLKYMKGSLNNYTNRLGRLIRYHKELQNKPFMFTCSAGDSQIGINSNKTFGMCHRMFYSPESKYLQKCGDLGLSDIDKEQFLEEKFTSSVHSSKDKTRLEYVLRAYHDFWSLKLANIKALIFELMDAGQVRGIYWDKEIRILFSLLLATGLGCQADNLSITGSQFVPSSSMVRLWGNGAFETTFQDYMYWR